MPVTFAAPSGSQLPSRTASRSFTATRDVAFVAVRFVNLARNEEVAFRDGAFRAPYSNSTKVGNVYTVTRTGGWPADTDVELLVEEVSATEFALTPTRYAPLGQWALAGAPIASAVYVDRSGSSRPLTSGVAVAVPNGVTGATPQLARTDVALALVGEMTVTARAWAVVDATTQVLVDHSAAGASETANTIYTLGSAGAGALFYYRERTASATPASVNAQRQLTQGRWYFLSWRRAANGEMTFGIDDYYEVAVVTPPTGGSAGAFNLGRDTEPGQLWKGGYADVSVYGARLTDAEIEANRTHVMRTVTRSVQPVSLTPVAAYLFSITTNTTGTSGWPDRTPNAYTLPVTRDFATAVATPTAFRITGAMTVHARLKAGKPTNSTTYQVLMDCSIGTANVLYRLAMNGSYQLAWYHETGAKSGQLYVSTLVLPDDNAWHWVSWRRGGDGVITIGLDGVYQSSTALTLPTGVTTTQRFLIGRNEASGEKWFGAIDDVMLWNTRLTDVQLAAQAVV